MICADKKYFIQKRILPTLPKVSMPQGGGLRNERSPRGYLRKPFGGTIISAQVGSSKILLSYNAEGCTVYVKACDKCQRFNNFIRQPSEELTPMTAPWPFAQ